MLKKENPYKDNNKSKLNNIFNTFLQTMYTLKFLKIKLVIKNSSQALNFCMEDN